ncbi:hypothetical protein BU14_0027s0066 [Porphyra umbilicalis]|uniref:Uncharacterized protein n=1 Tax=Porphyra umbilicalis TaxID=2786 RepID=A0A1X6PJP7_PORUM|nr:hypothetical protein BU14_0027s0066 [Porphyra umbilicalis]|eukprot:OSX81040.1 hypothetical protein BU14_0027s0066 [Porphyra umbilicalis]
MPPPRRRRVRRWPPTRPCARPSTCGSGRGRTRRCCGRRRGGTSSPRRWRRWTRGRIRSTVRRRRFWCTGTGRAKALARRCGTTCPPSTRPCGRGGCCSSTPTRPFTGRPGAPMGRPPRGGGSATSSPSPARAPTRPLRTSSPPGG